MNDGNIKLEFKVENAPKYVFWVARLLLLAQQGKELNNLVLIFKT